MTKRELCNPISYFLPLASVCMMQMMFCSYINRTRAFSSKTTQALWLLHFLLLTIFSHWTLSHTFRMTIMPSENSHTLFFWHPNTHTHTPLALMCESCEGHRLAFSIWPCYCSMYERSEWRQRTEAHTHSPSLSSAACFTPIICTVSAYSGFKSCHCVSVLENMSLCWQGYGEIRCV